MIKLQFVLYRVMKANFDAYQSDRAIDDRLEWMRVYWSALKFRRDAEPTFGYSMVHRPLREQP